MGMGYAPSVGFSVSYENLKEMLPNEVSAIENHPDFESWGELAEAMSDEVTQGLKELVFNLYEAFQKATECDGTHLKLNLLHYDTDSGDRYDEVNDHEGCVFEVYQIHDLTPAGQKFQHLLEDFGFVVYG